MTTRFISSLFPLFLLIGSSALAQKKNPNVIIILTDDQGSGDVQSQENPVLKTSNLDKLENLTYFKKQRFYVGGLSMGGMGTYELLRRKPKTFAADFAICGGDNNVFEHDLINL